MIRRFTDPSLSQSYPGFSQSSPDGWDTMVSFWDGPFLKAVYYVSFRECICLWIQSQQKSHVKEMNSLQRQNPWWMFLLAQGNTLPSSTSSFTQKNKMLLPIHNHATS